MADGALDDEARERFRRLLQEEEEARQQPAQDEEDEENEEDEEDSETGEAVIDPALALDDDESDEENLPPIPPVPETPSPRPTIRVKLQKKKKAWPHTMKTAAQNWKKAGKSYRDIMDLFAQEGHDVPKTTIVDWVAGRGMTKLGKTALFKPKEEENLVQHINLQARLGKGFTTDRRIQNEMAKLLKHSKRASLLKKSKPSEYTVFFFIFGGKDKDF